MKLKWLSLCVFCFNLVQFEHAKNFYAQGMYFP